MKEYMKVHPEYECSPIWIIGENKVENINAEDLAVSGELKELINRWRNDYDNTLNISDPITSGFSTKEDEINFGKTGVKIWKQMLMELENTIPIRYYNILDERLYEPTEVDLL